MATPTAAASLGELLEPYPYLGVIKGSDKEIAKYLLANKPEYNASLANSYGYMPAFYTTDKAGEAVIALGELPFHMFLVKSRNDTRDPEDSKIAKKAWIASAKALIGNLKDKGVELDWIGKVGRPFWLSDWRHLETTYQNADGTISDVTKGAILCESAEYSMGEQEVSLLIKVVENFSKHTFPYLLDYEGIEKFFKVETIYHLSVPQLEYIIKAQEENRLCL